MVETYEQESYKSMLDGLYTQLTTIPDALEQNLIKKFHLLDEIVETKERLKMIEDRIKGNISAATTPEGKKMYTNDDLRKRAFLDTIEKHDEYSNLKKKLRELEHEQNRVNITLEVLQEKSRSIRAKVKVIELLLSSFKE